MTKRNGDRPRWEPVWEHVTPAKAKLWLDRLSPHQRKKKLGNVARMARDLSEGRWEHLHTGIAFDTEGFLIDGQNRLHAVVDSGVSVWLLVSHGLSAGAAHLIDTGMVTRNLIDSARFAGVDWASGTVLRSVRSIWLGDRPVVGEAAMTRSEEIEFVQSHREALEFLGELFASHVPRVGHSAVKGAVGRAWYHEDHNRLREFVRCLYNGYGTGPEDSAALMLLRWLQSFSSGGGDTHRREIHLKAERAIWLFCRREPITKLYAAQSEEYPLPGERRRKTAANAGAPE